MKLRNALIGLAGLALAASAMTVSAQSKGGGNIVCWKDASGKTIGCGDRVPLEYQNRATRELDKQGNVRKTGESAEEAAARQAREREAALAKEDAARRAREQKRQDDALLNIFTNEKEIDLKRDREVQALDNFISQQNGALKGAHRGRHRQKRKSQAGHHCQVRRATQALPGTQGRNRYRRDPGEPRRRQKIKRANAAGQRALGKLAQAYCASLRLRISFTCCGLALPLVAFMAWPTSELNAFSLPAW